MRRFLMVVSLVALTVNLIQGREKRILAQEEEEETVYSGGIKVNLTEEEVQEAINWGAENKDSPIGTLESFYKFGIPKRVRDAARKTLKRASATTREKSKAIDIILAGDEYGYISTTFYRLAELSYRKAREYKSPERSSIDSTLMLGRKKFGIYIFTYGGSLDFAKNYHMVIKQGEKVIQPTGRCGDERANMTSSWPNYPSYRAMVSGWFSYSEIDLKGKATIILIKDRGESEFEVDFSKYK